MSVADNIAVFLDTALTQVRQANGYLTDIGTRRYQGRKRIAPDDVPCVVVFEGEEQLAEGTRKQVKNTTRYVIEAFDLCDADNPNVQARRIVADLKKVIFDGDLTMGGSVRNVEYRGRSIGENVEGTNFVSAQINLDVTYADALAG